MLTAMSPRPLIVLAVVVLGGCMAPTMTIDNRSALEQQLTRTAIARAVERLPIHKEVLTGSWKIVVTAPDPTDRDWIASNLRHRLVELGVDISPQRVGEPELPAIEARVVMAGSDIDNFAVALPISLSDSYQLLGLYQWTAEYGRARLDLVFWDANGALLGTSPEVAAETNYTSMFFLTVIGPFSFTDLERSTWGRALDVGEDAWSELRASEEWIIPSHEDAPEP